MEPAWAWRVLGVPPGTPPAEVRSAFRRAAQLLHPDRVADLTDDVRAEAHRRMVELADAYRICSALAAGGTAPRTRITAAAAAETEDGLPDGGERAAALLAAARSALGRAGSWHDTRHAVTLLEQVADGFPGTAEADRARLLLVTSAAASGALSARERAGHLVLVVDPVAREAAWDSLAGRDELAVAQVVYAHPLAPDDLRRRARQRLAELDDWSTLATDPDADVRRNARAHLLLRDARSLAERAPWLGRRDRPGFDRDFAAWRAAAGELATVHLATSLRDRLAAAEAEITAAAGPARARS